MPPGNSLTHKQRVDLYVELLAENEKDMKLWFVPKACNEELGEIKCDNLLMNQQIERYLSGVQITDQNILTLVKVLGEKQKENKALLKYARRCNLPKIIDLQKSKKEQESQTPSISSPGIIPR